MSQETVAPPPAQPKLHEVRPPGATKAVAKPPRGRNYHSLRKMVHAVCVLVFITLPFFNVMRFDIPRQRFYFAGYELWINEFAIIFFALMFMMFLIAGASIIYGRVYCSYLCPQMIFSEASIAIEQRIRKFINKQFISWKVNIRNYVSRVLFFVILGIVSIFLSFVFISYFVEPRDLLRRLLSLDIYTAGGIAGASTTLITFLDFTLVRQRFCTTVCPYGYLQGMLGDKNTLIVQYRDDAQECIECKKCVRVCEMGIDIRKSPYQIECVHCGECIDACDDVLRRVGKDGLIHYAWGEHGKTLHETNAWYRKLGFLDAKRVVLLLILVFYAAGLFTALSMRQPVLVQIAPIRTTLYRLAEDGRVYNRFRLRIANRGKEYATVTLDAKHLPGSVIQLEPLLVKPGETIAREFEIAVKPALLQPGVNHFALVSHANTETVDFKMTFITPE